MNLFDTTDLPTVAYATTTRQTTTSTIVDVFTYTPTGETTPITHLAASREPGTSLIDAANQLLAAHGWTITSHWTPTPTGYRATTTWAGEHLMVHTTHDALYAEFLDHFERATSIMAMLDSDHDLTDIGDSPHVIDHL